MTTYHLTQALAAISAGLRQMQEVDGEISTDIAADLPEETASVEEALRHVVRYMQNAAALSAAAGAQIEALQVRAKRFADREARCRGIILAAMDAMQWRIRELPEATLSLRDGKPGVLITDEAAIPDAFMRVRKTPDKTTIKAALEAGNVVAGAVMANGLPVLSVRDK